MLKLYHAEPAANSLKVLLAIKEKGVPFESHFVNLHRPTSARATPGARLRARRAQDRTRR